MHKYITLLFQITREKFKKRDNQIQTKKCFAYISNINLWLGTQQSALGKYAQPYKTVIIASNKLKDYDR